MPFGNPATYACRSLQQKLVDYYGANSPELKTMGSVSLIRYLLSPQNTRGFVQISDSITPIPGKLRGVAFRQDAPYCYDICSLAFACTDVPTPVTPNSTEIVFDLTNNPFQPCDANGVNTLLQFTEDELMRYCTETDQSYIHGQMVRYNKRFIEALDKRIGEILATKVGKNALGAAQTNIPFFIHAANFGGLTASNAEAFWALDQIYRDIGGDGQYALVGGKVLNKIIQYQKWAGLNDLGIDLTKIESVNPYAYYDRNLDATLGINKFFMLSPGAVQLVTWNRYKGEKRRQITDLYTHSTWIDPVTGLEVDYEWVFDFNCKKWTYRPYIHAELAVVQPGGCGLPDSNGVLLIDDCSSGATMPVCPAS